MDVEWHGVCLGRAASRDRSSRWGRGDGLLRRRAAPSSLDLCVRLYLGRVEHVVRERARPVAEAGRLRVRARASQRDDRYVAPRAELSRPPPPRDHPTPETNMEMCAVSSERLTRVRT